MSRRLTSGMIKVFCSYAHEDEADLKVLTEIYLQLPRVSLSVPPWWRPIPSWEGMTGSRLRAADRSSGTMVTQRRR
jgi:hypothetical protein